MVLEGHTARVRLLRSRMDLVLSARSLLVASARRRGARCGTSASVILGLLPYVVHGAGFAYRITLSPPSPKHHSTRKPFLPPLAPPRASSLNAPACRCRCRCVEEILVCPVAFERVYVRLLCARHVWGACISWNGR